MRICCLATQVTDHTIGGMAYQTMQLAADLARLGHELTILTTARADGAGERLVDGVRVHYLAGTEPGSQTSAWWTESAAAFRRLQRECSFDIVWSQSVAAASVARTLGAGDPALVAIVQGTSPDMIASVLSSVRYSHTRPPLPRTLRRIARQVVNYAMVDQAIYRRAALVLPVSRTIAHAVRRLYRVPSRKLVVVPNAVDTDHFKPVPARRAAVRARFGLGESERVFLSAGILGEQKGVDLAIEAMATLGRGAARLLVAGDGPLRARLEALARARGVAADVVFAGAVPHDEMAGVFDAADVVVFPTLRREGLPGVVIEALAAERPVIASRTDANEEILEEGRTGFLVPIGDVGALAARLRTLADDPARAREMGTRGRAYALAHWTPEARSERIVTLFSSVRGR